MKNRNDPFRDIPVFDSGLTDDGVRSFSDKHKDEPGKIYINEQKIGEKEYFRTLPGVGIADFVINSSRYFKKYKCFKN